MHALYLFCFINLNLFEKGHCAFYTACTPSLTKWHVLFCFVELLDVLI